MAQACDGSFRDAEPLLGHQNLTKAIDRERRDEGGRLGGDLAERLGLSRASRRALGPSRKLSARHREALREMLAGHKTPKGRQPPKEPPANR